MTDIRIRLITALNPAEQEALFGLHARFFSNLQKSFFLRDLAEKDYIIISKNEGQPVAFSTIKLHDELIDNRRVIFIFSGDTIVHPMYWQSNILIPAFAAFLGYMLRQNPAAAIYWYLISKGFRTYLLLPGFFYEFYPHPQLSIPPAQKALLDYISRKRFGRHYDEERGIISYGGKRDYLANELNGIPAAKAQNKWVRFFLEKNPCYTQGDELACLTPIEPGNIKPLGSKLLTYRGVTWEI
jgi:hypothetical protein